MSNETKNKVVPKLRFLEFRDRVVWEESTLNDYLKLLTDFEANGSFADVKKNVTVYDKPNFAWYVRATDLENSSSLEDVKYVDQHSYEFLRKTSLVGGELLISKRGEIGKVFFYQSKKNLPATVAPNLYLLKMNEKAVPKFFFYFFISSEGNQLLRRLNASSTIGALYKDDVKNIRLYAPPFQEQQKIADCLSSLDELITAQSQKLQALKTHKKGLMQQLFPAEGETVPKLRFAEFKDSGEWEEKTLSQVANYENGKAHEQDIAETGDFIVVNSKFISTSGEVKKFTNSPFCIAKEGDILMVLSDVPNGRAIAKCFFVDTGNLYTVNQRICKITPFNANGMMLFYILNRNSYFLAFDDGVKQTNLRNEDVLNFPFLLPPTLNEQQKIADCLSSLDEQISAQAEKIEALKTHKKGLMQALFPSPEGAHQVNNG